MKIALLIGWFIIFILCSYGIGQRDMDSMDEIYTIKTATLICLWLISMLGVSIMIKD